MEKILKQLDLQRYSAECFFYCIDSYDKGEYIDGMLCQLDYLRSVYDLECSLNEMEEEDKQLMYDMFDWIQGYNLSLFSNTDIPMYEKGNEENTQDEVVMEYTPLAT
jgi:hypothetical protein